MSTVCVDRDFWRDRRVLVTGHTGFMGGWLGLWLSRLDAQITGYALEPPTEPNFFESAIREGDLRSIHGDVRDLDAIRAALDDCRPEIVFHLAAQPLVRRAYDDPVTTYATNIMGTVNLLEALRDRGGLQAVVVVTTDKIYENREWAWGYRENDALGGEEPYGASKAAADIVTRAFHEGYFIEAELPVGLATARVGNVIGGGDWAEDRWVPDAVRAFTADEKLVVRFPDATRPWQHVLEPLRGYLLLAERLAVEAEAFSGPWNFGPAEDDVRPVSWIAERLDEAWGGGARVVYEPAAGPRESRLLSISSAKSAAELGWRPVWRIGEALDRTVEWYRCFAAKGDTRALSLAQIEAAEPRTSATPGAPVTHAA